MINSKTFSLIVLVLGVSVLFSACQHKETTPLVPSRTSSTGSIETTTFLESSIVDEKQNGSPEDKSSNNSRDEISVNEEGKGSVHFGMSLEEMKAKFGTENMSQDPDGSSCTFFNTAKNTGYDVRNNEFYQINYFAPGAKTSKGLEIGDGYAKMIKLYGKKYKKKTEEGTTYYTYTYKNTEFWVSFGEGSDEIYYMSVRLL